LFKKDARILVVDDEKVVRDLVRYVLKEEGYKVLTASNGRAALGRMSHSDTDLVLLDIKMPGIDGLQVLERIRRYSDIPVIILTGIDEITSLDKALGIGADDYITKPFSKRELIARIKAKLRRAKPS